MVQTRLAAVTQKHRHRHHRRGGAYVLDAEERFENALRKKAEDATSASAGGFPVLESVSNRIGQALDRTPGKPPERVVWEGTQQFFCVFSVAARRFTKNKRLTQITRWYFGSLILLIAASIFYSHQGDPAGVVGRINMLIGILALVLATYIAFGVWEWRVNRYAITSKRLMGVTGILSKDVGSMPNNRFTDAKISVSLTARVFEFFRLVDLAWATWNVESAGQDQALKLIRFITAGHIIGPFYSLGDTQ
jgi:membrane protein YdbS with pleckstrin-like domain